MIKGFLKFVKDSFDRVLVVDSEYRYSDDSMTIQEQIVCFVYKDVFTGDKFNFWEADKESSPRHFDWRNVLLIPFVAVAEGHSWLSLLHGKPNNIWDTYVENARLYKTMRSGKGALNLLSTAHGYGINETMTKEQKDEERNIVIDNKTYTPGQRKRILKYCLADVETTEKVFLKQLEDIEKKNNLKTEKDYKRELTQIMFRGASQLNVAQVERNGIPFDNKLVDEFNRYWPRVKLHLIERYNKLINVFDEHGTEKNNLFQEMVKRNDLFDKWPRTFKTGELVKDKKVIAKFSTNKEIKIYQKIKYLLNLTELSMFKPGRDGRMRTSFHMFGTETGRCTPSTNTFVFGGPSWVRNFIKPSWGNWCVYLDYSQQEVAIQGYLSGEYIPRIGLEGSVKADGRDIIPSPYLSGLLDKFLDGTFQPSFETARGCPFLCTFCDQGLDESKITTFSTKRLADEMMYVGEKMSKIKNGTKLVSIFDSNWGLFQKDVELADHILKVMEKYDWPQHIKCTTPKTNWDNLLKINDKLKNRVGVGLSMQSVNLDALKIVKRKNWTRNQYIDFAKENHKRGKPIVSEMIIPLPGETEETFFEGVKFLMDQNVRASTFTLMMLCGADLGRDGAIKKFEMKSKFRVLSRQFGEYYGKKIFEIEQICVGTNTMSFQSYLKCRNYNLIVQILGHPVFRPVYKLTQKIGVSWYNLSRLVADVIQDKDFKGKFKDLYNGFCEESHNELFDSKEEVVKYYSKSENYKSLVRGDIGGNLLAKYTAKAILIYNDILTLIFYIIRNKLIINNDKELNSILNSSEKWLKNLYLINEIFEDNNDVVKNNKYELDLDFDFPSWLTESHLPFDQFKKYCRYEINYNFKKINNWRNEIRSTYLTDKERSNDKLLMSLGGLESMSHGYGILEKNFYKVNSMTRSIKS